MVELANQIQITNMVRDVNKQSYIHFNFDWTWIKDKHILHNGNGYGGALGIVDSDGVVVKLYAYTKV